MDTEIEFLKRISKEINTAEFGEGIAFNLESIKIKINERIEELDVKEKTKKK